MRTNKTILLGINNNMVITANVCITDRNGYNEFTTSFNVGEAFNVDERFDEDYRKDYFSERWDCLSSDEKLNELNDGYYTKDEVFEMWENNWYDYTDFIDCSCTNYEITHENKTINFETVSCGQHDVRDEDDYENMIFTNKELFELVMYYWDYYHLKEINEEQKKEIEDKIFNSEFLEYNEEFEKFIINNLDWSIL